MIFSRTKTCCVGIIACSFFASKLQVLAQEDEAPVAALSRLTVEQIVPGTRVIGVRELANLQNDLPNAPLLKLNVSQEQFLAHEDNARRVDAWVRAGGTVVMHSDVARSFGFSTVMARLATFKQAGQLFGRARSAQWFGQHPVLWNGLSRALEGKTFGALGVRLVWTQMAPGDCHVTAHKDGIALLRVADLSTPEPPNVGDLFTFESNFGDKERAKMMAILPHTRLREPITAPFGRDGEWPILQRFAMVMAPWGKGWALVMPRAIETHRGDGARLAKNFREFVEQLNREWVGIPMAPLQRAALRQKRNRRVDWARVRDEIKVALQSESANWSEVEVREIYARDRDATLDNATVSEGFSAKNFPGEAHREAMHAIAQGIEARYRGRFLGLAQSKTKILLPATQLRDLMDALDEAAKVQAANGSRDGFGPLSAEDELSAGAEHANSLWPDNGANENPPDENPPIDANGNRLQVLAGDADAEDESAQPEMVPTGEGEAVRAVAPPVELATSLKAERKTPTYRRAAGWVSAMLIQARAQSEQKPGERADWMRELSRTSLDDETAWLWRALFAMGAADVKEISAIGRVTLLDDALASWQKSLRAHWKTHDLGEPDAIGWQLLLGGALNDEAPLKLDSPLRTNEIPDTTLQNFGTQSDETAQNVDDEWFASDEAREAWNEKIPLETRVVALRRRYLGGQIGGVPCEQIAQWMRAALLARELIRREPAFTALTGVAEPVQKVLMGGLVVPIHTDTVLRSLGDGTASKRGGAMLLGSGSRNHKWTFFVLSGGQLVYTRNPIRGTLETNFKAMDVLAHQSGRKPDIFGKYDHSGLNPMLDDFRAQFLTALVDYIGYHQATREFGWGLDTLDVMTFSNPVLAQQFARAQSRLRFFVPPPSNGAFGGLSSERSGPTAQIAGVNPLLSPLGVSRTLMLQSTTQGRVVGTRLLLTMPTPGQLSHQALLRRSAGLPSALARLQATALLNSITEGGIPAPAWLADGLANVCRLQMAELLLNPAHPIAKLIPKGKKVRPDFVPGKIDNDPNTMRWSHYDDYWRSCAEILLLDKPAQAPSTRLVQALYRDFGNGGVTEILQRLGSGQNLEMAFYEVTGQSQTEWLSRIGTKRRR